MAEQYNQHTVVGNLGRDPELKKSSEDKSYVEFSIGCTRRPKKGQKDGLTDWFDCIAWGTKADFIANYAHKGDLVLVSGRAEISTWEKDGVKHSRQRINLSENGVFQFLSSKDKKNTSGNYNENAGNDYQNQSNGYGNNYNGNSYNNNYGEANNYSNNGNSYNGNGYNNGYGNNNGNYQPRNADNRFTTNGYSDQGNGDFNNGNSNFGYRG